MTEFRYLHKGQILTGYGEVRPARSAEKPGGMIDKTRTGADGLWVVVPSGLVIEMKE